MPKLKFNLKNFLPVLVFLIAFILRFYKLGSMPPALQWDEVAIGYDAYSILKTGRDQFGKSFPVFFRSLDDWKPGLYEYAAVLPVAIFGLNSFAVRVPAAFFGFLTVVLAYFLVKKAFEESKLGPNLALLTALFLAISPWHLQISRVAFEVTISIFLLVAAVWLFLKDLKIKNKSSLLISSVLLGLGFFTYHSARVVFPLIWLGLLWQNRKMFLANKKYLLQFILPFLALTACSFPFIFNPEVQVRFKATNVLNIEENYQRSAEKILKAQQEGWGPIAKIIYNRRLSIINLENIKKITTNYFVHFRPDFLFTKADVPLHHAPNMGLLYLFQFPFIIIGLAVVKRHLKKYPQILLFLFWFLLAALPASVTWGVPHAIRSALFIPMFSFFTGLGFLEVIVFLKEQKAFKKIKLFVPVFSLISGLFLLYNISFYLKQYYIVLPHEISDKWLYGRKQAVEFTKEHKDQYDKVVVSTKLEFPWIFWLFYSQYDPETYLKAGGTASGGFAYQDNKFDKYEFREFNYQQEQQEKDIREMFVGLPEEFPENKDLLKEIHFLNGEVGLIIAR